MRASDETINWILRLSVGSLAAMVIAMVIALLVGLFMPNEVIDNKDIFPIIGPAFNTVMVVFRWLRAQMKRKKTLKRKKKRSD
jgi:fumarate reductase subunit D